MGDKTKLPGEGGGECTAPEGMAWSRFGLRMDIDFHHFGQNSITGKSFRGKKKGGGGGGATENLHILFPAIRSLHLKFKSTRTCQSVLNTSSKSSDLDMLNKTSLLLLCGCSQ